MTRRYVTSLVTIACCTLAGCLDRQARVVPPLTSHEVQMVNRLELGPVSQAPSRQSEIGLPIAPRLPDEPARLQDDTTAADQGDRNKTPSQPSDQASPSSPTAPSLPPEPTEQAGPTDPGRVPELPGQTPQQLEVLDRYPLAPGDQLELVYTDQWPLEGEYRLLPGDDVRVEYLHLHSAENKVDPDLDRTVQVQPDGRIALPYVGMVMAAGKTVAELATELNRRYEEFYVEPQILATLEKTGTGLKNLWESLRASGSRLVTIAPDGVIGVPFLGPVPAAGMTLRELQNELQARYSRVARNLSVTVRLAGSRALQPPGRRGPYSSAASLPVPSSVPPRRDVTSN